MRTWRRREQPDPESGQVTLLILGYALIVLAVVLTGVDVTAVQLARHRLLAVADGAALAGADALDRQAFYTQDGAGRAAPDRIVPLTGESVRAGVAGYLAVAPAAGSLRAAIAEPTGTPDGFTAQVTLVAVVRLPLLPSMLSPAVGGITVRATARARARQLLP